MEGKSRIGKLLITQRERTHRKKNLRLGGCALNPHPGHIKEL